MVLMELKIEELGRINEQNQIVWAVACFHEGRLLTYFITPNLTVLFPSMLSLLLFLLRYHVTPSYTGIE